MSICCTVLASTVLLCTALCGAEVIFYILYMCVVLQVVRRGGWRSPTKQLQFSVLWRSPLIPFPYSRRSHFVKSWNEAQSTARSSLWLLCGILGATTASVVVSDGARDDREKATHQYPVLEVEGHNAFETVIVGGGTAGCTLAYLLAKWMEEMDIPGTVLLVERG